jgi:hypothetical protein
MWMIADAPRWWVKIIRVWPGQRTSLQSHDHRSELHIGLDHWYWRHIGRREHHRMTGGRYLELAWGDSVREDDLTRISDDYGRT